jgi:uncharacterized protein with PIN domain
MSKLKAYHCMNNKCGVYLSRLKKGVKKRKDIDLRWIILRAHLEPGSFVEKTYCPNCKWELKIGLEEAVEEIIDNPQVSVLDLLRAIPPSAK